MVTALVAGSSVASKNFAPVPVSATSVAPTALLSVRLATQSPIRPFSRMESGTIPDTDKPATATTPSCGRTAPGWVARMKEI
jgi:hypothetical protein